MINLYGRLDEIKPNRFTCIDMIQSGQPKQQKRK